MFEHAVREEFGAKCITAKGRIDALTAPDVRELFDSLIVAGERQLIVDMAEVNYVSSAGLRVFLAVQKQLKNLGGEVVLLGMNGPVLEVFEMSGLTTVFRTMVARNDLAGLLDEECATSTAATTEINGISLHYVDGINEKGSLFVIGSTDKMASSSYGEEDVVPVKAWSMQFGGGLGALGDSYEDYKDLFGEAMVINGSFFYYPAVSRSSVDFFINAQANSSCEYRFLHGYGFNGPYRYTLSFEAQDEPVDLDRLTDALLTLSEASVIGVVILAESKGVWGIHLKKSPLLERRPENGQPIFGPDNFAEWVSFPVEPTDADQIVVAVGIVSKGGEPATGDFSSIMEGKGSCHMHGGVFGRTVLSTDIGRLDEEMLRVLNGPAASKVEHLLGCSTFSRGLAAIIDLET